MGRYKICVYAICKNEEKFIDRWMDAVSEADLVVVLDTGSTDKSVEKLRNRGALVYEETIWPWRFDIARNLAMDHIPEDVDICVSNDIDEVFDKGWREKLERAWKPWYTRAQYLFTWTYKADGTPDKQFIMEKIHRRKDFRWVHPVHEVLAYTGVGLECTVPIFDIVLNHHPDPNKSRGQYLPLLELSAKENPEDDRTAFWLGREYFYYERDDECISQLKKHLKLKSAKWGEERSASMRVIAEAYKRKGDIRQVKNWLYRAIAECPDVREPYLSMARLAYEQSDWHLCLMMAEKGLGIKENTGSYLVDPLSWGYLLEDYAGIACYNLGLYERAYEYIAQALEKAPNELRLRNNLNLTKNMMAQRNGEGGQIHEEI